MDASLQFLTEEFTIEGLTFQPWMPIVVLLFVIWIAINEATNSSSVYHRSLAERLTSATFRRALTSSRQSQSLAVCGVWTVGPISNQSRCFWRESGRWLISASR